MAEFTTIVNRITPFPFRKKLNNYKMMKLFKEWKILPNQTPLVEKSGIFQFAEH